MTSEAQLTANRANAELSTGPKTPEGKAAAARNAIRHGLTSTATLLPGEDDQHYRELRLDILNRLSPLGTLEAALAENVVTTFWKYLRMERIESAYLAERTDALLADNPEQSEDDGFTAAAALFGNRDEARKLSLVLRYLTSARNAHAKAVRQFERARTERGNVSVAAEPVHSPEPAERSVSPQPVRQDAPPVATPPPNMTRAERRALERAWRKAGKRAERITNRGASSQPSPAHIGFVSQSKAAAA